MQIKSALIAALTLTSLAAEPVRAEKAEVLTVAPTVVSKVWPAKRDKAARVHIPKVKPPLDPMKILHNRMIAKETLTANELQQLADSGDSLAAFNYARLLEDKDQTSALPTATHYYAMASFLGREFAMHRLIALMKSPEVKLSDAQIKGGKDALVKLANAGNTTAALGLADMYAIGQPFALNAAQSRVWLMHAAKSGDANAAQKLAQSAIMPPDGSAPDVPAARAALTLMLASNEPGKVAMAQTLLARLDATSPTEVSQ